MVECAAAKILVGPDGSDVKLQAAQKRKRTGGAPLAARKERFCLSDLQAGVTLRRVGRRVKRQRSKFVL